MPRNTKETDGAAEVKVEKGVRSEAGWGKLKTGEGWISLDYAKRV